MKAKESFDVLTHSQAIKRDVLFLLPEHSEAIERLSVLIDKEYIPTVTVVGKYNHGKSRLLNELIGASVFEVSDRRETVKLKPFVRNGVCWLDAPGLDADVASEDDKLALQATWLKSDIRLFVHAAKEGELDAKECELLEKLRDDDKRTGRQTLFVLTQVEQLDDESLRKITEIIKSQAAGLEVYKTSSTSYRKGIDDGKKLLLERSGLPALFSALDSSLGRVVKAHEKEVIILCETINKSLDVLFSEKKNELEAVLETKKKLEKDFKSELNEIFMAF